MKAELRGNTPPAHHHHHHQLSLPTTALFHSLRGYRQLGALDGACVERLLLHCAAALESNDATLAQQVMWVLNNVASPHGDPNQRLAACFLKALVSRASHLCPTTVPFSPSSPSPSRPMTVTELAGYIDLTPWHRFGFSAANSAILSAVQSHRKIHVLDFGIAHCMQWPTLIDALAKRPEGPPSLLRITVPSTRPPVPPSLTVTTDEVGFRLANFAKLRDVPFEFNIVNFEEPDGIPSLGLADDEALAVNCHGWLRYLPVVDEPAAATRSKSPSLSSRDRRDGFLEWVRGLSPRILTVTDEDSDLDSPSLTARIMACFNYLWIPFDALETLLPKDSPQRLEHEADVGRKIENVVGFEGRQRVERPESCVRAAQRIRRAGFAGGAGFGEGTAREVKGLLDEHASGWGMRRGEEDNVLVLTWKGHGAVFTTAWVPQGLDE